VGKNMATVSAARPLTCSRAVSSSLGMMPLSAASRGMLGSRLFKLARTCSHLGSQVLGARHDSLLDGVAQLL
jgi:hypothetical protein